MEKIVPAVLILIVTGVVFFLRGLKALKTGVTVRRKIPMKYFFIPIPTEVYQDKNPTQFWVLVTLWFGVSFIIFGILVAVLSKVVF